MMMKLDEQYKIERERYMAGKITHTEFYEWLATAIGVTQANLPVDITVIRASQDPHLNDIPLHLWDRQDPIVRHKAASAGMRSWSLCDTVCVLKAYARKVAA